MITELRMSCALALLCHMAAESITEMRPAVEIALFVIMAFCELFFAENLAYQFNIQSGRGESLLAWRRPTVKHQSNGIPLNI